MEPFQIMQNEIFTPEDKSSSNFGNLMIDENIVRRNSRPEVFCKKGVLRNFAKFTGKHLRQSRFFNKVAGLQLY